MELRKEGKIMLHFWAVQWDHVKLSFRTISEFECCQSWFSGQGGREVTEKSVLETFDEEGRDLCVGQENMGWTLKFPYILECEEEKAVPKS